ncbi:MAG: hypothetical protein HFI90_01535 [Clostridia bacterium]|nr:hypothetical protein [Clostridia bacterium]
MKYRKKLSWTLLTGLIVSLFAGIVPAAAEMTPAQTAAYYSYTIGNFVEGYEGYAYEKEADFASLDDLKAFPAIAAGSGNTWDGVSVVNGKPVMSKANDVIDFLFPTYDDNEIEKPTAQKSYALFRYSLSATDANFQSSPGQTARHQNGKMEFNQKGASGAVWTQVTDDIQKFAANDILTIKTFQDATRQNTAKLLEYTTWVNNETKNTGFVKQLENVNPQASASNQNIKNYNAKVLSGNAANITIYGWASYEQYEYLLRETIRSVETELLGSNRSLQNVTSNLKLPQDLALNLDKGHVGSVKWTSSNEEIVNSQTGVVTRSKSGDQKVTLTAVYTVSGAEGEKTKTIAYPITVPTSAAMTPEEAFYYRYTMGKMIDGYNGYAYENDLNFASLEELKKADNIDVRSDAGMSVGDGKAKFGKGAGEVSFIYPDKDIMGNDKPVNGKMYSETAFSVSPKSTFLNMSSGAGVKTEGSKIKLSYRTEANGEAFQEATADIQNFAANDILRYKFYLDATRKEDPNGLLSYTTWIENSTKNTGWILQKENYNPRWGSTNTSLVEITFKTAAYNNGVGTAHSVSAYERFEYLLRDLVKQAEKDMLQGNAALSRVETDLRLQSGEVTLDKGCKGTVTWESTDAGVINPQTGKVERSTTEDKYVTLTATYSVADEKGETKEKVIAYEIFVPMNAPLRKLADRFTWDVISNTQTADSVRGDLNLVKTYAHESVPDCTAAVSWTVLSGGEAVNTETGEITRQETGDVKVELEATLKDGDAEVKIVFPFTVPRYISPQEEADAVAQNLTWESISTEAQNSVTKKLTLPGTMATIDNNTAQITWNVSAGSAAATADGTVTPQSTDTLVVLEAVVSCGGAQTKKEFQFVVLAVNQDLEHFHVNFKAEGDKTLADSSYAQTMKTGTTGAVEEGYSAQFVDGKGLQLQSAGANADTDKFMLHWNMLPSAAEPAAMENLKTTSTIYEVTMYVIGKDKANVRVTLVDAQNRNAILFTARNDIVGLQAGNKWNAEGRAPWGDTDVYPTLFDGETGPRVTFRAEYNHMTGKLNAYVKLADYTGPENYGEYYQIATDVAPNNAAVTGVLSGMEIDSCGTNNAVIESVRCYTTSHAVKEATSGIVEALEYMNGQNEKFVVGNLEFPQVIDQYGASISWKSKPQGYFDERGNLLSRPAAYETVDVAITPVVTFANAAWASAAPAFPAKTVTVVGVNDENAALNKKVSVSGAKAAEGSRADYITDGSLERGFSTDGTEKRFDVIVDMGDAAWNKLKITEGEAYNVASYEISVSEDRRNWRAVQTGTTLQLKEATLAGDEGSRYVRLSVQGKTFESLPVHIKEIEAFFEPSDDYRAKADLERVTLPTGMVKQNFVVPAKGAVYGSEFAWTSSRSDILSIAAAPSGEGYLVTVTQPERNTPVTLTLKTGNITKQYQVTVQGKTYGGGGIGGGAGSGSGGGNKVSGGSSSTIPYLPTEANRSENIQLTGYFPDVTGWAESYINRLYEHKVVSGDAQGYFHPDAGVSRSEYIKMLTLTLGIAPDTQTELPFTDVSEEHWARPYIAAAYKLGIISGISETEFGVDRAISRQDLAVMTNRALEKMGRQMQQVTEKTEFTDAAAIAPYAAQSVETMQQYGIINGMPDGGFHPLECATRGESAKILCGVLPN